MIADGQLHELNRKRDRIKFGTVWIHSVSGDACLILKVRTAGPGALEVVLARIYAVPGVLNTRSYVALRSYLERGISPATGLEASGTTASSIG